MITSIDYKSYQQKLNKGREDNPLSETEAATALRNLGELVWLLYKINQRENIVPLDELAEFSKETPQQKGQ